MGEEKKVNGEQNVDVSESNVPAETPAAAAGVPRRVSGGGNIDNVPAGFEQMDQEDLRIARLSLVQGLSQVAIDGKARMGELFNTITSEVYGDSIEIIPLFMFKTRAHFDPERGLVMMSRDNATVTMAIDEFEQYLNMPVEEVPGSQWDGKTPPLFTQVWNFPCLLVKDLQQFPVSLSMMKTAAKMAKTFLSMARYTGEDMFARVYRVSSKIEKGTKGTYAVPIVTMVRRCTDEEYATAKNIFDMMYRRKDSIDVELTEEHSE